MATSEPTPFAAFVKTQRISRKWSQETLAAKADISSGTVSLIERDLVRSETSTAEKIADAFGYDRSHVLDILAASHPEHVPTPRLDPQAARLLQKITDLPPDMRTQLIAALDAQVDVVATLAARVEALEVVRRLVPELVEEAERPQAAAGTPENELEDK